MTHFDEYFLTLVLLGLTHFVLTKNLKQYPMIKLSHFHLTNFFVVLDLWINFFYEHCEHSRSKKSDYAMTKTGPKKANYIPYAEKI